MGQDRIERIRARRQKREEEIAQKIDEMVYNPSQRWSNPTPTSSPADYPFTSGIKPTKVEKPYATISEQIAEQMTPVTPEAIAEQLPEYKSALDIEEGRKKAFEENFTTNPEYRAKWFQENVGMPEEEFKAAQQEEFAQRFDNLLPRAEAIFKKNIEDNAIQRGGTGLIRTIENLGSSMAAKSKLDELRGLSASFKHNNLWSGMYEGADLLDVLSGGLADLTSEKAYNEALKKQANGEELSEEEQFAIDASNLYDDINDTFELLGGRSGWNKTGKAVGQSAEFTAGMLPTSGLGFAPALMKNLGLKAGWKAVKTAAGNGLRAALGESLKQGSKVLGRGLYNWGLSYAESIPRAVIMPGTYSRYWELRNERLKNGESLDGNWLHDAGQAGIEMTHELASEIWGSTFIHDSFRAMGKALGIDKAMNAVGLGRRSRTIFGWTPSAATREAMRNLGYSGDWFSEVTSEAAGDVATNLAMGIFFDDAKWDDMKTQEYWTTLLGATALQGLGFQSIGTLANIPEYKRLTSIEQKRDKAVKDIQSEELRKKIQMAFTHDDAAEMGKALASVDWDAYNRIDVANAMDAVRLEVPLRIATGERAESERVAKFAPQLQETLSQAYQGVDANNPIPQAIIVDAVTDEGANVRIMSGDYHNPNAMLNVVDMNTGKSMPILASKVMNINEVSIQQRVQEDYRLMFSTEENVERLGRVMQTLNDLAYYGTMTSEDAIDVVKRAGFTVYGEGSIVTLVNGQQVEIAAPMMPDGHYLVRDANGNASVVGMLDVLQPAMEVVEAQVQIAQEQEQQDTAEATEAVEEAMAEAMPQSPMPEGVAYGEAWVTPQGIGRVLEYNPQTGKVYMDINLSSPVKSDIENEEIVAVDVADLQRKPSEAEMSEARNRSVRRNALMIYDETSDAVGAIQEQTEQPMSVVEEVVEEQPTTSVPSMEDVPTTADGAVDYEAITDADMYAKLLTQDLGSKEEALGVVNTSIEAYEAEIADLQSKKEKSTTKAVAKKKQIEAMQQQLDVLNQVRDILAPQETMAEVEQIAETPQVEVVEEIQQEPIGLVQDDFTATLPKGEAELIDSLARSLGLSVEFVDQVNKGNSNAQILGNKVLIAKKNRDKAIKFLVGHEFTHRMQDLSPEAYAEFKAAVKEYMGEEVYNSLLQKEIAKYREHNIYRTQEQLEDEVIADFAGSLAFETDVLDTFIAAHADKKSMWQAILDVLRAIREWILKDTAYDTAEARALQNTIGKLENLLQSASEKVAEGATAQNTEARRSLKEQVAEILDEYNTEGVQYSTPRDVADALEGVIAEASEDTTMLENIITDYRNAQDDSRIWGERWDSGGEEAFIEALQMWSSPNTQYSDALYSLKETDPATLEALNNGEKIKVYRGMQVIDGKLYPPMSAKVDGKMREPIELGVWERAEERPDLADAKGYFKLDKGNKTSLKARYNPYIHTSLTPLNDQFSSAQDRPNLVTVEVEIPASELTSGYKADKAKDAVGKVEWKAGVVQSQLSGTRTVILSRWDRPLRIVPDSEVAQRIVEMFGDKKVVMPSNVVTPSLRAELEKLGVPFKETDNQGKVRYSLVSEQIETLFNEAVAGNLRGKPISIGTLTPEGKEYLEQISGLKLRDRVDFVLNPSDLRHIYNEHYGENEKDKGNNIPLNTHDIRRIIDVISFPDKIVYGVDKKGIKCFFFLMGSPEGTYNLLEVYSDGKGAMSSKTYYKTKKGVSQRAISLIDSLHSTPEADGATLSNAKIQQIFELPKVEPRKSLKELDAPYLDAVARGDMATAERLVREAAAIAMPDTKVVNEDGLPKVVYHQTNATVYINRETGQNWDDLDWRERMEWDERDDWDEYWEEQDFNTFSRVNARTTNEFDGFFFAPEYDEYHEYGNRTISAFLNITNPASREDYDIDSSKNNAGRDERLRLQSEGYDGVIREEDGTIWEYVAFEPNQIKSADPVTYDDAGNIIPLSERFNPEKEDIRYSLVERIDEKVTFENFFKGTSAIFTQISEKPTTKPDYTSRSGSRYWYGEDDKGKYVIRQSDHWSTEVRNNNDAESFTAKPDNYNNIASCYWAIDVQGYDAKYEPINITDVKYIDYNADYHKLRINLNSGRYATRVVHPRDMRQYYTTQKAEGVQAANEYVVDLVNDKYNDKPLPNVLTAKAYLDDFTKWKVERHSLKDEATEKIFATAKTKFGTTYDMREAGWILPDGSMLDFSGKHEIQDADTSFLNGRRSVDHRAIQDIAYDFDENETGVKTDLGDFLDRGAIRIDYNAGSINLNVAPTKAQKDRLRRLIERNDGDVYIDFGKGWDTEHYVEYESARPTRVLGDIDRYFGEGIKPTGNVQYSLKDTFYSNAENAVRLIKQEKATPEQWLKMIEKNGGLKAGEDKWLGLSDWLKEQMRGPVKEKPTAININGTEYNVKELEEQILSDIKAMLEEEGFDDELIGIRLVGSYMRGEQRPDSDIDVIVEYKGGSTEDTLFNVLNDEDRRINIGGVDVDINPITEGKSGTLDEWEKRNAGFTKKPITLTKDEVLDFIHQNQIQIEEVNYAEVGSPFIDRATRKLEAEMKEIGIEAMREKYPDFDDFFEVFQGELVWSEQKASEGEYEDYIIENNILDVDTEAEAINETRLRYTTNGLDNNREIALTVPTIEPWNTPDAVHFGDAGGGRAVAWIRFGETTDAEGKRVLVIDEIQSKRHQEGREKGYRSDEDVKNAKARLDALQLEQNALVEEIRQGLDESSLNYARAPLGIIGTDEQKAKMKEYDKALNEASREYRKLVYDTIPNAPFEKNWAELAMKRMLRYAAENGYDKVAWTTGEQQADRYGLAKKYDYIEREDNPSVKGKRIVLAGGNYDNFVVDDNAIVISSSISEAEGKPLADLVGKDMAEKMMSLDDGDTISGDGLRIGGEGMKAFYDQMLPSFVRKYAKKWGASVGEVTMPNLEENNTMHSVDVTPAMRESVMQGQPLFSLKDNQKAETIAYKARRIGRVYGVNTPMIVAVTPEDYRQGVLDTGVEEKDFDPETSGVYLHNVGYFILNSAGIETDEELVDTIIHEESHRLTHNDKYWQDIAGVVALIDGNRLERFSEDIFGKKMEPMNVADEIIATFIGQTAVIQDGKGRYLLRGYISGEISIDEVISIFKGKYSQKIKENYADIVDAMLPFIRTNIETIKIQSNDKGRINGGDVLISGRGYRPSVEETAGDRGLGDRGVQSPSIGENVRHSQEVSNLEAPEQFARQSLKDNVGDEVAERLERIHQDNIARINNLYDDRSALVERRAAEIARQTNGAYKRSWSNAQKVDFLFPDGITAAPIADQVLADIARGQKLRWNDSPDGRKRGLSTELGLDSARAEGMGAVTNGATTYVEDYIEQLYEANNGYERGLDDQDIRNAVLDMFSRYPSPKTALQELEDTYLNEAESESAEEALRHIDIERENALREENRRYAEDLARYAENPQLVRDEFFASDMQAEFIKEEAKDIYDIVRQVRRHQKMLDDLQRKQQVGALQKKLDKQQVSRAEQKQIIDEIKQKIRKALNPRNARYFNSVKLRSLINIIDASYTIKGMARAMNRVLSTFFDVNYRLEKERRDALTKSRINFNTDSKSVESYLEGEVAAGHISKGTMERILADRWRGVNSRGVSVAKYIAGDTAVVMDFIAQNLKWDESKEPSAQRYELIGKAVDMGKEKNYSHELIDYLIDATYILEDYWLAEQMLKVADSYSAELEQANKNIAELEEEIIATQNFHSAGAERDEIIAGLQRALDEALRHKQTLHDQHFADMPNIIAAMNRANNSVAAVLATGRVKLSQERYEKKKHEAEIVQDALDDLTNYGNPEEIAALDKLLGISGINRQESWLEKTKQRMWDDYIWSLDYMLRSFGRFAPDGTGRVYMRFMPALNAAWSDYRKNLSDIQKRIDEKIRSLWGNKSKSWKRGIGHNPFNVMSEKAEEKHIATITYTKAAVAWNTTTTEGGVVEVSRDKGTVTETMDLSLSQAMYMLASWGQSDGRMKLEANGIKQEHIAQVREAMQRYDERYLDFMDWVIADLLPSLRERYNEVHKQLFGTYMTSVDNYFPLKVTDKGRYIAEDVSQERSETTPLSINPGAIINRTHNTNMIDLKQNFFKVLAKHISEMERWATMMPVATDINALMSNGTVRNYTKAAFGPSFHTQLRDRFAVATGQGIRSPKLGMESTINTAMRYWASSKIGFRFFTGFKQIASLPAILTYSMSLGFLKEVGVNMVTGLTTLGVYPFRYCIDKFPMFRERVANLRAGDITLMKAIEEGSTQVAEQYKGAFKTMKTTGKMLDAFAQYLGKAGFAANMWVDALSSGIIAMSVYNYEYKRLQKQGYTAEQADKMAIFLAENTFNQTQQSAEYAYLAPGQLSPRMFDKAITVFQNSTFLYSRQGVQGLHEMQKSLFKTEKMRDNIQRREARRLHDLYISQGLSEEEAQAKAAQEARKIATREWVKSAVHGAGGFAWGLFLGNYIFNFIGNLFAYCNFWDDEDERNRLLWEDVKWNLLFSPVRGFPGGGSVMGYIQYGRFEPFGAMSEFSEDIAEIYKMLNKVGEDGFNEQIAWLALEYTGRWGIGVDIKTVTNLYNGIISMAESGMSTEAIMQFLNAPQSQMRLIANKRREGETFKQYLDRVRRVQTKYEVDMSKVPYYTDEGAFIGSDESQRMTEKQEKVLRTVYRQYEEAYRKDVLQRTRPEITDWDDTEKRYKKVAKSLGWKPNKNPNDDRAFNEAGDYIGRMPRDVYEQLYFLQGEVAYHAREAARFLGNESDYAKYLDSIYMNRKQLIQLYDDNSTK